VIKR
jgi:hypothetical protein